MYTVCLVNKCMGGKSYGFLSMGDGFHTTSNCWYLGLHCGAMIGKDKEKRNSLLSYCTWSMIIISSSLSN